MNKRKNALGVFQWILMIILFLITLTMLVPLLHILARSLSDPLQSGSMGGLEILPRGFTLINYQVILSNKNLVPAMFCCSFPLPCHHQARWGGSWRRAAGPFRLDVYAPFTSIKMSSTLHWSALAISLARR